MTNFIFKSQGTYKKLCQQLAVIQNELRHQRCDNREILMKLDKLLVDKNLQKQVDQYFEDDTSPEVNSENIPDE